MRLGHALVLVVAGCGGRTGLGGDSPATLADAQATPQSTAYKAMWPGGQSLNVWRSSTSELGTLTALHAQTLACTYDGRFIAVDTFAPSASSVTVVDANGSTVRTQSPWLLQAIRPDGMRLLVEEPTHELCSGTLDADGTFGTVRCGTMNDHDVAVAYAPDGKTVLWEHLTYDPVTTLDHQTLITALEDGTASHEIAPADDTRRISSESFSFDGGRVAYVACRPMYSSTYCDLKTVRLDTLEVTTFSMNTWLRGARFTPDGASIVFLEAADPGDMFHTKLRIVDLATKSTSTLLEEAHLATYAPPGLCVGRD